MKTTTIVAMGIFGLFTLFTTTAQNNNVGIGTTTPDASAVLEASSTTQGFLPPRMTNAEREAIASPAQGLMIYCTNCGADGQPQYFNGTSWVNLQGTSPLGGPPILSTTAITAITAVKAVSGGNITDDDGSPVSARGVCWSLNPNPTTSDFNEPDLPGTGIGSFVSNLSGLSLNTTYYVRAYATNGNGTNYGNELSFSTAALLAIGDEYEGGKVGIVSGTAGNQSGVIVAPFNQGAAGTRWSLNNSNITTGGNGYVNTDNIVASQGAGNYAAYLCDTLTLNGQTDWYLPSLGQLQGMNPNRTLIGLSNAYYWSSQQYTSSTAWYYVIGNGLTNNWGKTASTNNFIVVRAVRSFCPAVLPATPGTIAGNAIFNIVNASNEVYSISAVANASSYEWKVPAGASIVSGQGTTSITVNYTSLTTGNISVRAVNDCKRSAYQDLAISYVPPQAGDLYEGGIVAYIFQSGDPGYVVGETHGLIVAPANVTNGTQNPTWGCYNVSVSTSNSIGAGPANTVSAANSCGATSAAGLCANYSITINSVLYDDWYLPSLNELLAIYSNNGAIGLPGGLPYYSSSQINPQYAYYVDFDNGSSTANQGTKTANLPTRPVRSF